MRRVTWYASKPEENAPISVTSHESFDIPELKPCQILIKVTSALLVDRSYLLSIEGHDDKYSLANDVVGIVERIGSEVFAVTVGDVVIGIVDTMNGETGLSTYCIIDEGCTVLLPPNVPSEDVLSIFSSYLQSCYMVYLLPKVPLKHTFLVAGNTSSCASQFLIKKLVSLKCKVIVQTKGATQQSVIASRFPEAAVLEVISNKELLTYVSEDTFDIGISAIFHIDEPLNSSDACDLVKCLSVNGTIVSNCGEGLSDSFNFENVRLKSPVFHLFNYEATIHCGMFSTFFNENSNQLMSNSLSPFMNLIEKNVIALKTVEDYVKVSGLLENTCNRKTIIKF